MPVNRPEHLRERLEPEAMLVELTRVDSAISSGHCKEARGLLEQLAYLLYFLPEPDAGQLRKMIVLRRERLARAGRDSRYWDEPGAPLAPVECNLCGTDSSPPEDERGRRACQICAPSRGDSVKAWQGGLPGLGKTRR
jgi:hypothetical protein